MGLQLIQDSGESRLYKLSTGEIIKIEIDDFEDIATVTTSSGAEIGSMEFSCLEFSDDYKLRWMYLDKLGDKYKRRGIGRQCVLFFKEIRDCLVFAEQNDGIRKDDGSHLTEDAPGFIQCLREENIIEK